MSAQLPSCIYFQVHRVTPVTSQSTLHAKGITARPFSRTTLSKGGHKEGPEYELLAGHRDERYQTYRRSVGWAVVQRSEGSNDFNNDAAPPFWRRNIPSHSGGCVGNCIPHSHETLFLHSEQFRPAHSISCAAVHFFKVEINATSIRVNWPVHLKFWISGAPLVFPRWDGHGRY